MARRSNVLETERPYDILRACSEGKIVRPETPDEREAFARRMAEMLSGMFLDTDVARAYGLILDIGGYVTICRVGEILTFAVLNKARDLHEEYEGYLKKDDNDKNLILRPTGNK